MRETEELDDGTRIARRGALWHLLDESGDPVGGGYHEIEPAPVADFYYATRGSRTFVVDARGTRVSAGYHEIEYLGGGEFRGTDGASEEAFALPADAPEGSDSPGDGSGTDASGAPGGEDDARGDDGA